jgi:hypothetical protein
VDALGLGFGKRDWMCRCRTSIISVKSAWLAFWLRSRIRSWPIAIVDHAALLGFGRAGFGVNGRRCVRGRLELLESGFDQARCDLPTTGLCAAAPTRFGLVPGLRPTSGQS